MSVTELARRYLLSSRCGCCFHAATSVADVGAMLTRLLEQLHLETCDTFEPVRFDHVPGIEDEEVDAGDEHDLAQ